MNGQELRKINEEYEAMLKGRIEGLRAALTASEESNNFLRGEIPKHDNAVAELTELKTALYKTGWKGTVNELRGRRIF